MNNWPPEGFILLLLALGLLAQRRRLEKAELMWLLQWLKLWPTDASLRKQRDSYRTRYEAKALECELLAETNENLRRWLMANTAVAVSVARLHGIDADEKPKSTNSASAGQNGNGRLFNV